MALETEALICKATDASQCSRSALLQSLWSGYGSILRYDLIGANAASVIVKHISPPQKASHPRGWNTDISHQRKLKSYQVETNWYQNFAEHCGTNARVPQCLASQKQGDEILLILEDLDASGFAARRTTVNPSELRACLDWLAHFHATFLNTPPDGLWERGTYWHLETRPDELEKLSTEDPALWRVASSIDAQLNSSPFQTLVHGDAKLANFCFSPDRASVAVVDFQYVGRGCGMQDLAYFIGSCFHEEDCEKQTPSILDHYFKTLRSALFQSDPATDLDAIEADWRRLFPVAWTDFHRFLKGWSPGHWKIHGYSERLAQQVIAQLDNLSS